MVRDGRELRQSTDLIRRVGEEVAPLWKDVVRLFLGIGRRTEHEFRCESDRAELERDDDPEITASSLQGPEQFRVFRTVRADEATVCRDEFGGQEIVDAQVRASPSASRCRPTGSALRPRCGDQSSGCRPPERRRCGVHIGPGRTAFDEDAIETGETRTEFISERSMTRPPSHMAYPATLCPPADGKRKARSTSVGNAGGHIGGVAAARDQGRPPVDHPVPNHSCGIIVCVVRPGSSPRSASRNSCFDIIGPPFRPEQARSGSMQS